MTTYTFEAMNTKNPNNQMDRKTITAQGRNMDDAYDNALFSKEYYALGRDYALGSAGKKVS